uniref:SMB domain-containing protein n=1 Tax=Poecilia mexicana TaxID=48701 RepID=A0A3B3WJS8_9TELE
MKLCLILLLSLSAKAFSCLDRCENGFQAQRTCQCDSMCKYYKSCCSDYEAVCGMTNFNQRTHRPPETNLKMTKPPRLVNQRLSPESELAATTGAPRAPSATTTAPKTTAATTVATTTVGVTTAAPDPDAQVCSGRPFDSFMQLKNGSIYAFRGEYFFEMDQKSVLPGYPKLIKDVWGISGPIDAAFTRINCQGKTYMFKGNKYWRFDDGVLEDDYPRDISVGFDKIPDHVDAAFALPAHSHHGKEKVYFFKGDQYYVYEFLHQPSHEECATMSERSPSTLFRRYTDLYYSNYERFFMPQHHDKHHFINKDWKGLKSPVDAAMTGRIYIAPLRSSMRPDQQWGQQYQQNGWQRGRRRQNRSPSWGSMAERGMSMGQGFERLGRDWDLDRRWNQDWDQNRRWDRDWDRYNQNNRGNYDTRNDRFFQGEMPIQSVYFFKADKYYRVDLRTKRVDPAMPPYPRSIAKYWLGCPDPSGAEKK